MYSTLKPHLQYQSQILHLGDKNLESLTQNYSEPCFVYSMDLLQNRFEVYQNSLPNVSIHYAMKANPHPQILKNLKSWGSKVDVVSAGEMERALQCGFKPEDIIFSGVGKTVSEIQQALKNKIHQINVESVPELQRIAQLAKTDVSVALRLNPDVEVDTHDYVKTGTLQNKFGVSESDLPALREIFLKNRHLKLRGMSLHLGSQILEVQTLRSALRKSVKTFINLAGEFPSCQRFDFGGGLGIHYESVDMKAEENLLKEYSQLIHEELKVLMTRQTELQCEPGRWLVGHCGVLLCQVQYVKENSAKKFLILDSGMNHLLRPSLYNSYHGLWSLKFNVKNMQTYDVVGPICESSDYFAENRSLPQMQSGDFLVVADCGAYGASMSSDYNLRPRAKDIFL